MRGAGNFPSTMARCEPFSQWTVSGGAYHNWLFGPFTMNGVLTKFVLETEAQYGKRMHTSEELFKREPAPDEFVDLAVIGGYGIRDIVSDHVKESQIPAGVLEAFHLQYPHAGNLVDLVRAHNGDDAALAGIVNGIKGKLFEIEYVDYLNHGHLPSGTFAELAHSPTQPAWDIAIRDSHGEVVNHLQLKATESLSYIRDTIAHHPEIDVVTTHEVFQHLGDPDIQAHLIDSDISNAGLEHMAGHGVEDHWFVHFHVPWIAFGIIAFQSWHRYRKDTSSINQIIDHALRRGTFVTASCGVGYLGTLLSREPVVGFLGSLAMRIGLNRHHVQGSFIAWLNECRKAQKDRLELAGTTASGV